MISRHFNIKEFIIAVQDKNRLEIIKAIEDEKEELSELLADQTLINYKRHEIQDYYENLDKSRRSIFMYSQANFIDPNGLKVLNRLWQPILINLLDKGDYNSELYNQLKFD